MQSADEDGPSWTNREALDSVQNKIETHWSNISLVVVNYVKCGTVHNMKAAAAFISTSMSSKCMQTSNNTHPSGFLLPATSYVQHLIGFETFQRTAPWQSFLPQSGSHLRLTAGAAIRQTSSPTSLKKQHWTYRYAEVQVLVNSPNLTCVYIYMACNNTYSKIQL